MSVPYLPCIVLGTVDIRVNKRCKMLGLMELIWKSVTINKLASDIRRCQILISALEKNKARKEVS